MVMMATTTHNLVHPTYFNDGLNHCSSVHPPVIAPRHAFRSHNDVAVQLRKVAVLGGIEYVGKCGHVGGGGRLRW
jgi:hypothetical protein